MGDAASMIESLIDVNVGFTGIIASIVGGFCVIIFSKFIAESISALSAIANNTKK